MKLAKQPRAFPPTRRGRSLAVIALLASAMVGSVLPASGTAPGCVPPPGGLVGWWRGESSAADAIGGNTGTIAGTGVVTYGPGVVGQAFVFDGTHRDRIDLGNPTALRLENFTLQAWVKRSSATLTSFDILGADGSVCGDGACIIGYGRGGYILALANDGRMILSRTDIDGIFSAPLVQDQNWHHLAVTKSGATAVFYLDGVAQATPVYDHPAPYTFDDGTCACSAAVAIGSRGDGRGGTFFGAIDEPAVFNRALSAEEVWSLFAAGGAGMCSSSTPPVCAVAPDGLISWWRGESSTEDAIGGNPGTIAGTGAVTYGPGVAGQAFVFDGTHRDRVDLHNPVGLQLEDFTLQAWVKRSSTAATSFDILGADGSVCGDGACIIGYGRGGYILALANDGRMILSRTDIDGIFSAPLVQDRNWHHLAVTKSGSSAVFYLDGVAQATPAYDHPAAYSFDDGTCSCSAALAIGSRGDGRGGTFYGMIDEPAVFGRALSAAEVRSIYDAGSAGICHEPPTILTQPLGQKITVGLNAEFSVAAGGTAPLRYQWRFNGDDLAGATTSTLSVPVGEASGGAYSVCVTNAFGTAISTNAALVVNHPPVADASATPPLVISANNTNAAVALEASRSSDADGDLLQYEWFAGGPVAFATGVVVVATLPVGTNLLALSVSDGLATDQQTFAVEVITPAQAVERLVALARSGTGESRVLTATLSAALAAIDRSNPTAAVNQLHAFQNQVRAQVSPLDADLGQTFVQAAQAVIDTLAGASKARSRITLVSPQGAGKMRVKGEAAPGARYVVEASTNLADWEMIGVATEAEAGVFEFEDHSATPASVRFYRLMSP